MQLRASQLPILVLVSALSWGLLLNGFFVYLPSLSDSYRQDFLALIASVGWGIFGVVVYFFGRQFLAVVAKPQSRNLLLAACLTSVVAALVLAYLFDIAPLGWLLLTPPFAVVLLSMLNRAVLDAVPSRTYLASAWLGAAPLIGLTAGALLIGSVLEQANYLFATALIGTFAIIVERLLPIPETKSFEKAEPVSLLPKNLILFGLSIGMAISLANSFVYFRTAEAIAGDSDASSMTSLLILLASAIGILASLSNGLKALKSLPSLPIALVGGCAVLVATLLAVVPGGYNLLILVALLLGVGFGILNGLELRLVRQVGGEVNELVGLNSRFLLVTTLPYLIAPSLGQLLFGLNSSTAPVFLVAAMFAAIALVILTWSSTKLRA